MLLVYFAYVLLISPWFSDRPHLRFQPAIMLSAVVLLFGFLASYAEQPRFAPTVSYIRDWLPIVLTLAAFREMEFFLPPSYDRGYERMWMRQDHFVLVGLHVRSIVESCGKLLPGCLELCYFLIYGLPFCCVGMLYLQRKRAAVDRFLFIYLAGTLAAYALFPYFPTRPPRLAFPGLDEPTLMTPLRHLNLYVLRKATIHVGVFPSAHVSSAFSAGWAMLLLLPERRVYGFALLAYALSVALATLYGRYHYSADIASGFALSLAAGILGLVLRRLGRSISGAPVVSPRRSTDR